MRQFLRENIPYRLFRHEFALTPFHFLKSNIYWFNLYLKHLFDHISNIGDAKARRSQQIFAFLRGSENLRGKWISMLLKPQISPTIFQREPDL